jgi:hypothetical protein
MTIPIPYLIIGVMLVAAGLHTWLELGRYRGLYEAKKEQHAEIMQEALSAEIMRHNAVEQMDTMRAQFQEYLEKPISVLISPEQVSELSRLIVAGLAHQAKSAMN